MSAGRPRLRDASLADSDIAKVIALHSLPV
jgi:hypothetical protein